MPKTGIQRNGDRYNKLGLSCDQTIPICHQTVKILLSSCLYQDASCPSAFGNAFLSTNLSRNNIFFIQSLNNISPTVSQSDERPSVGQKYLLEVILLCIYYIAMGRDHKKMWEFFMTFAIKGGGSRVPLMFS